MNNEKPILQTNGYNHSINLYFYPFPRRFVLIFLYTLLILFLKFYHGMKDGAGYEVIPLPLDEVNDLLRREGVLQHAVDRKSVV